VNRRKNVMPNSPIESLQMRLFDSVKVARVKTGAAALTKVSPSCLTTKYEGSLRFDQPDFAADPQT
jgi:hypothetical protein